MYVVKENEITDSMYMIHTGTVEEVAEDLEEQTQLLHDDDNFGIVRLFQLTGDTKSGSIYFYFKSVYTLLYISCIKIDFEI